MHFTNRKYLFATIENELSKFAPCNQFLAVQMDYGTAVSRLLESLRSKQTLKFCGCTPTKEDRVLAFEIESFFHVFYICNCRSGCIRLKKSGTYTIFKFQNRLHFFAISLKIHQIGSFAIHILLKKTTSNASYVDV